MFQKHTESCGQISRLKYSLLFLFFMEQHQGIWSIHSIASGEAKWFLEILLVNADMQQSLTMWSMVCWSWPHSYLVFDAPFVHQMPASCMQSSDAVDGGPLASKKVKPWR